MVFITYTSWIVISIVSGILMGVLVTLLAILILNRKAFTQERARMKKITLFSVLIYAEVVVGAAIFLYIVPETDIIDSTPILYAFYADWNSSQFYILVAVSSMAIGLLLSIIAFRLAKAKIFTIEEKKEKERFFTFDVD